MSTTLTLHQEFRMWVQAKACPPHPLVPGLKAAPADPVAAAAVQMLDLGQMGRL